MQRSILSRRIIAPSRNNEESIDKEFQQEQHRLKLMNERHQKAELRQMESIKGTTNVSRRKDYLDMKATLAAKEEAEQRAQEEQ